MRRFEKNTDYRTLEVMQRFPDLFDACLVEDGNIGVPDAISANKCLTALACQRWGGIYSEDNLKRLVKNLREDFRVAIARREDGTEELIVQRIRPRRSDSPLISFDDNEILNARNSAAALTCIRRNFKPVQKRIQKTLSKY